MICAPDRERAAKKEIMSEKKNKTVVLCGGSKGGIGKSMCAGSLVDCLLEKKVDAALIDCDKANPDAALWCGELPKNRYFRVPLSDEWDPLLDDIPGIGAEMIVVNMGAGDAPLFVEHGEMLRRVAQEEGWRLILSYLLSPTFGSVRPLYQVAKAIRPWMDLCVLRNQYFPEDHWVLWKEMTLKDSDTVVSKDVRERGAKELDFPLMPGKLLLQAHRPGFKGLLATQQEAHGALRVRVENYRLAIAKLAKGIDLL